MQAFEEKFDVLSMVRNLQASPDVLATSQGSAKAVVDSANAQDRTRSEIGAFGPATLAQTSRHRYTDAWYVIEPRARAGVAAFKQFGDHHTSSSLKPGASGEDGQVHGLWSASVA